MSTDKKPTRAGRGLFVFVMLAGAIALGWAFWSLPGWVERWQPGPVMGLLVTVVLGFLLVLGMFLAAGMLYAILSSVLEFLGIKVEGPAAPPVGPDDRLSGEEEQAAAGRSVHCLWYVYTAEDAFDNDITWGVLVAVHPDERGAETDRATSSGAPAKDIDASGRYVVDGPCNLLALKETGMIGMGAVRHLLVGLSATVAPKVRYSPHYYRQYLKSAPLTREECERAFALKVWTIYYEDRFKVGPNRESYPVAVCFSAEEAEAEVRRRGPVESRSDGYLSHGPYPLILEGHRSPEIGADTVREVLRRVQSGERGTVPLR